MIYSCPICGDQDGLTHGDQAFVTRVCDDCAADPVLMAWYREKKQKQAEEKARWFQTLKKANEN